jgi:hypothetical protein
MKINILSPEFVSPEFALSCPLKAAAEATLGDYLTATQAPIPSMATPNAKYPTK